MLCQLCSTRTKSFLSIKIFPFVGFKRPISKSINVDRVNTNQLSFKLNSNIGIVYNVNNLEIELINSNFKTFDLCN